jgi:hypothetical protein
MPKTGKDKALSSLMTLPYRIVPWIYLIRVLSQRLKLEISWMIMKVMQSKATCKQVASNNKRHLKEGILG